MCIRDRSTWAIGIRGGMYHINSNTRHVAVEVIPRERTSFLQDLATGLMAGKNPWILICFILNFLQGVQGPLGSALYVLWVRSFYGDSEDEMKKASIRVASLSIYNQIATFGVIIGGSFLMGRVSKFYYIIPGILLHILGYLLQVLLGDPESWIMAITQIMQGLSASGLSLVSAFISNRYAPAKHRGKVFGVIGSFQVVGTMISNSLGGFLFDEDRNLPYIIFIGVAAVVITILFGFLVTYNKWKDGAEAVSIDDNPGTASLDAGLRMH
eukprot:TRINITY_DN14535_c0_g1_i1.p1 TRINITY_DN14535_c0_g1~~TRINITY_DN14535_c0_g1_i1.p1  ORF type:complete len:288 (-),score=45.96 TRINITY_DN14535_c0_g1_i1:134-940(-)